MRKICSLFLVLAMVTTVLPAYAFTPSEPTPEILDWLNDPETLKKEFRLGEVIVTCRERFLLEGDFLAKEYPELDVESVEDELAIYSEDNPIFVPEHLAILREQIGFHYLVKLREKTRASVLHAVGVLHQTDPRIMVAQPNYVIYLCGDGGEPALKYENDLSPQELAWVYDKKNYEEEFREGDVLVGVREPFFGKQLKEEFPELDIVEIKDEYEPLYEYAVNSKDAIPEAAPAFKEKLGLHYIIRLREKTREGVLEAIEIMKKDDRITYVQPNYVIPLCSTTPNDPGYGSQWALQKIQAPQAWDTSTGKKSIKVAVVDTGILSTHPDLSANLDMSRACNAILNSTSPADMTDVDGHGTMSAGIIGAVSNNGVGVAGVNWNVTIVPIKVSNDSSLKTDASILARGLQYAWSGGSLIISVGAAPSTWSSPLRDALVNISNNAMLVMAAGNNNVNVNSDSVYASIKNVLSDRFVLVGATNSSDAKSTVSNYGNTMVDIAAPGDNIYGPLQTGTYGYRTGTSMAAAYVSGAIALVAAAQPSYSSSSSIKVLEAKEAVLNNCDTISGLTSYVKNGRRLNLAKAVGAVTRKITGTVKTYNRFNETKLELYKSNSSTVVQTVIIPAQTSGASGQVTQTFTFTDLLPGTYRIKATKAAHNSYTLNNVVVTAAADVNLANDPRPGAQLMTLLCGDVYGNNDMINQDDLNEVWAWDNYDMSVDRARNKLCDLDGNGHVNDWDLNIVWNRDNYDHGAVVIN